MATLDQPWHLWGVDAVQAHLATSATEGISADEVKKRQAEWGHNELPPERSQPWWVRFLSQFQSPLMYVLVIASVVTGLLRDYIDSAVIACVVVANALIGFIQEGRAHKALDAVRRLLSDTAIVIRGGQRITVDARTLVPGDLIVVEPGDRVPADVRVVSAKNLTVSEAALTGESEATPKSVDSLATDGGVADRSNMLYAGTVIAQGVGTGLVVAIGTATELGKIGSLVSDVADVTTPLTRRLNQFSVHVTLFILAIGAFVLGWGVLVQEMEWTEAFVAVVALSVSAIPEGLPAVVTIALAIATRLMAKENALIRRLPAVESLGSVSLIFTDKTGTLTMNEMTVSRVMTAREEFIVTGEGYAPVGTLQVETVPVEVGHYPILLDVARVATLCNHAEVSRTDDGSWVATGDPTEAALIAVAGKIVGADDGFFTSLRSVDEIPFDSERRFMATLHQGDGSSVVLVKGAPERVLEMCDTEWDGSPLDVSAWHRHIEEAARSGERVLALAQATGLPYSTLSDDQVLSGLSLVAMVGVVDPPRPEAAQAIQECHHAGVRVVMVTGDHHHTAAAMGEKLGLTVGEPLLGRDIDALSDEQLRARLRETDIVARATPQHKLRLVTLTQAEGELVAMTGDGVNDAPSLKSAEVGVAMGKGGTDAAQAASDVVLTDDRFETITVAVRRGRVAFDNIKKSLIFMLPTDFGEAIIIVVAVLGGFVVPVTASQILWINTVTAITLSLALVVEPAEAGVMSRGPRPAREPIITGPLAVRIVFVGTLIVASTFWVFNLELSRTGDVETARTAAVAMIVVAEVVYLFQTRRFVESGFRGQNLVKSPVLLGVVALLIVLQLAFTYAPVMNFVFETRPLDGSIWGLILVLGGLLFLAIEAEKWVWRRRGLTHF